MLLVCCCLCSYLLFCVFIVKVDFLFFLFFILLICLLVCLIIFHRILSILLTVWINYILNQCLESIQFWCGSGSWIRTGKKWIQIRIFWHKMSSKFFVFFFLLIFILKLDEPFRNEEIFIISIFFKSSDFGLKKFFDWYFTPWIRIRGSAYFCRKPKSCGSNVSGSGS